MHKFVWKDKIGNHIIVGDSRLVEKKKRKIQAGQGKETRLKK